MCHTPQIHITTLLFACVSPNNPMRWMHINPQFICEMIEAQKVKITCWKLHNEEVAETEVKPKQFGLRVHTLTRLLHHLLIHTIAWWVTRYSHSGFRLSQSSSPLYLIPISTGNEPGEDWLLNRTITICWHLHYL